MKIKKRVKINDRKLKKDNSSRIWIVIITVFLFLLVFAAGFKVYYECGAKKIGFFGVAIGILIGLLVSLLMNKLK